MSFGSNKTSSGLNAFSSFGSTIGGKRKENEVKEKSPTVPKKKQTPGKQKPRPEVRRPQALVVPVKQEPIVDEPIPQPRPEVRRPQVPIKHEPIVNVPIPPAPIVQRPEPVRANREVPNEAYAALLMRFNQMEIVLRQAESDRNQFAAENSRLIARNVVLETAEQVEVNALKEKMKAFEEHLRKEQYEKYQLVAHTNSLTAELKKEKAQVQGLSSIMAGTDLHTDLKLAKDQISKLNTKINGLTNMNSYLTNESEKLEIKNGEINSECQRFKNENVDLTAKLNEMTKKFNESSTKSLSDAKLQNQLKKLKRENEALKIKMSEFENWYKDNDSNFELIDVKPTPKELSLHAKIAEQDSKLKKIEADKKEVVDFYKKSRSKLIEEHKAAIEQFKLDTQKLLAIINELKEEVSRLTSEQARMNDH